MVPTHLLTTLSEATPTTVGGGAVSVPNNDPWVLIALALIGASGGIIASVLGYLSHSKTKETIARTEQVQAAVQLQFENAVGIPNGHGSLMKQTTQLLQNQHDIQQALARDASALTEHIGNADRFLDLVRRDVAEVNAKLGDHIAESAVYRASVAGALSNVEAKLDSHVAWEMAQKYPGSQPWDGTERRVTPPEQAKSPTGVERRTPQN